MTDETTQPGATAEHGAAARPGAMAEQGAAAQPGPGSGPDLLLDGDPTTSGPIAPDPAYPPILILGRDTCEDTTASRDHLSARGVPFVYRNIDLDPDAEAWNRSFNGGEVITPVILVGDPDQPSAVLVEPSNDALDAAIAGGVTPA